MGLLDIFGNKDLTQLLQSMAGQAQGSFEDLRRKAPGGMGGLLGAGALGALMGSMMPKGGARAAGMLGLGALALSFYKKWAQNQKQGQSTDTLFSSPEEALRYEGPSTGEQAAADPTAMMLLRAMIFAARADGHIDAQEQERIGRLLPQFFPNEDVRPLLKTLMEESLNPAALARDVQNQEQAEDLYRISCVIVDIDHFMERGYFAELAQALGISGERAAQLEAEAKTAKEQLAAL
ncbi:MAG: tellurite resistance TerB family protein [Desulfovibrio sp.]|nr:tellurite resistance TerB family protein [Desulfovibrio sp.]